jgi:hypothetical protein
MSNRLVVTLIAGFAFGVVLPGLQGCVEPNPDHCVNNRGDDYCAQRHPDWPNAYCSDNSCVDEITTDGCQQEIPLGCWFCAGKDDPDDDVPECSDMAEGDGDGDGDMGDGDGDGVGDDDGAGNGDGDGEGDMPCTGPEDCTSPDARFCDVSSGTCVNCAGTSEPDESCAGFDGAAPVCLAGECVACAMLNQDSAGVPDTAEPNDAFGTALASGDFDCDGYADLAIGAPGESKATADVGAVHILYGGSDRLPGVRGQFVQHSLEQADDDAGNWYFGSFLAAGNINGDERGGNGCDDLVVGIPGHGGSSATGIDVAAAGAVAVLYGGDGGIDGMKRENWHQGLPGIPDDNEANDEFGRGVWLVDDNLDGYRDLLVYSHGDDAVFLIYGASAGLRSSGATKLGPEETEEGWLRDACMWGCKFARLAGAPVPICGCVACELLSLIPPEPCPNCG